MSISIEKKIFLTPYWIVNTIQRNNLPLSTILDLDKLFSITSANDLASVSLLNSNNNRIFGTQIQLHSMLLWAKNTQSWQRFVSQIEPLKPLVASELEERLYDKASSDETYSNAFDIKDIGSDTLLVIIYPGFFGRENFTQYQNEITRELLKLLYAYEGYDNMAKREIFENYLLKL